MLFFRSIFNYYIISLCLSDFISALISPLGVYQRIWGYRKFSIPSFFCKVGKIKVILILTYFGPFVNNKTFLTFCANFDSKLLFYFCNLYIKYRINLRPYALLSSFKKLSIGSVLKKIFTKMILNLLLHNYVINTRICYSCILIIAMPNFFE